MEIKQTAKEIHSIATEKGFWEDQHRNFLEKLMLIVSECGEACEAYRKDDWPNVKEELADVAIRLFDLAEAFGIDIESEMAKKIEYNKTRPYKHGKRC